MVVERDVLLGAECKVCEVEFPNVLREQVTLELNFPSHSLSTTFKTQMMVTEHG